MSSVSIGGRTFAILAVKLLLAAALFWLLMRGLDWQQTMRSVHSLPATSWTIILCIPLLQAVLLGQRWRLITQTFQHPLSLSASTTATLIGFFFSQGLPASIGGDAFRIWFLNRAGVSTSTAAKTVFIDRLVGFFILVALTVVGLALLFGKTAERQLVVTLGLLAGVLFVTMILVILFFRARVLRTVSRNSRGRAASFAFRIYNWLLDCMSFVSSVSVGRTIAILALAMVVHLLTIAIIYIAAKNSASVTFLDCFAAVTPALLLSYLPISVAGWGVREAAVVGGFSLIGVPPEVSLPVSLLVGISVFFVSLLGGAAWVWGGFKNAYRRSQAKKFA